MRWKQRRQASESSTSRSPAVTCLPLPVISRNPGGVRELLPQLGSGTKAVMARDIRRELETYGATPGPIDDMAPWRVLLDAIEGEPC